MLVLNRKSHEHIRIGDEIRITVVQLDGNCVRLGVDAPRGVTILRDELLGSTNSGQQDRADSRTPKA